MGDGEFISYKEVPAFDYYFFKLADELKDVKGVMPIEELRELCQQIIDRIESVMTDDDCFPGYEIETIRELME